MGLFSDLKEAKAIMKKEQTEGKKVVFQCPNCGHKKVVTMVYFPRFGKYGLKNPKEKLDCPKCGVRLVELK